MKGVFNAAVLVALIGLTSGCAYTTNRLNDLTDICQAKITFGEGAEASGRLLWAGLGLGYSDSASIGFGQRGYGVWRSERTDVQFLLPYMNREDNLEPLAGTIKTYGVGDRGLVDSWPPAGQELEFWRFTDGESYESYLRLGLTVQLGIGADLELRPVEMVDFLLGFLTIDFRDDDTACMEPLE